MIMNEQEYRITKEALAKFNDTAKNFDKQFHVRLIGDISEELRHSELDAINSEIEVLERQIKEYEDKNK